MSTGGGLTVEQKRRIEENRQKALAKRALKSSQSPTKPTVGAKSFNQGTLQKSSSTQGKTNFNKNNQVQRQTLYTNPKPLYGSASTQPHSGQQQTLTNQINQHSAQALANQNAGNKSNSAAGTYTPYSSLVSNSSSSSGTQIKSGFSSNTSQQKPNQNSLINQGTSSALTKPGLTSTAMTGNAGSVKSNTGSNSNTNVYGQSAIKPTGSQQNTNNSTASNHNVYKPSNFSSSSSQIKQNAIGTSSSSNSSSLSSEATQPRNMFSANVKPVKGQCILISRERFEVKVGYSQALIELFKRMKTKLYDSVTKKWSFKLEEYDTFMKESLVLKPHVTIEPLPKAILQVFSSQLKGIYPARDVPNADLSDLDVSLVSSLLPFQREGVNFGVSKNGRVLIADDMGLGKTIQAICLACYYRDEWPLLVIVPSSVRYDWAQQIRRWVPSIDPQDISVATTGKDTSSSLINIVTYDLVARKAKYLQEKRFQVVIVDECHLLKNYKTARCKAALPILQNSHRVLLLSGTPALSRPSELFTQISAISPFMFKFQEFGVRYCDGKQQPWGWDFSGSSNMSELQLILEEKIMIRRLKKDVLKQLPSKVRQMVLLDPGAIKSTKDLKKSSKVMDLKNLKGMERRGALLEYFHHTATAKIQAVKDYLVDLLESDRKFLLFAHHQEFLDEIEELAKSKLKDHYIRIDGRTSPEQRNYFCRKFQENPDYKMAILSITAANAGLNLSAASLVVFGELFWNPGILVQAEDRAHRMGQQDMVNVYYLVAQNTADDQIWPLVQKKLDVLAKAGLSKDDFSSADTTVMKDSRQSDLMQFFEESFIEEDLPADDTDLTTQNTTETSETKKGKDSSLLNYFSCKKTESTKNTTQTDKDLNFDDLDSNDLDFDDWDGDDLEEPQQKKIKVFK